MTWQVDAQRRALEAHDDAVPGVSVLPTAMEEDEFGWRAAPADRADCLPAGQRDGLTSGDQFVRPINAHLGCVLRDQRELVVGLGVEQWRRELDFGHVSGAPTSSTVEGPIDPIEPATDRLAALLVGQHIQTVVQYGIDGHVGDDIDRDDPSGD